MEEFHPMLEKDRELILIAHNVRSAFNVGAILRTADGAGVSKVYLTGYTPVPLGKNDMFETRAHKDISKTALGAEKTVDWEKKENADLLIRKLKDRGVHVIALEKTEDGEDIRNFRPKFPCALILGNEVEGIAHEIMQQCDKVVYIPMRGKKESLNVSVAAGIAVYDILG